MIIDTLDNAAAYESLGARFAKAFDYLRSDRPATDPIGRHELDGDNLFAVIDEYTSRPIEQGRFESHRKYADVQYVVAGQERIGYAPLDDMTPQQAYDPETDLEFFTGNGVMLHVPAGTFTVFLPQDAHMPCIADKSPAPVRKVVVKIRING
jgi:YhcH/YjgK/YiaL family protein